jgi:hypothetical protein
MCHAFQDIRRRQDGLILPKVVCDLSAEQLADISNGCGPESMKVKLIPDRILGVNFRDACNGHDACYSFGEDEEDKRESDRLFLCNLLYAVDRHCVASGVLDEVERTACREAAFEYYRAVADWGDSAFWAQKAKPATNIGLAQGDSRWRA